MSAYQMSLTANIPEAFLLLTPTIQTALIRLAMDFYTNLQADIRADWEAAMSAEDSQKAERLREEGRKAGAAEMLNQVRSRLGAADALAVRLATAEETIKQLQAAEESVLSKRVEDCLQSYRKDWELSHVAELSALKEAVAASVAKDTSRDKYVSLVEESYNGLKMTVSLLTEELDKYKKAAAPKSSHALGKIGEATVLEMINANVIPQFPYSEVKNMTAVKHVGDFHVKVYGPTGKPVNLMLDAKKYSAPVQLSEVEKLYSDLDSNESDAGLMISLDSPIYTKSQFQITKTKGGKPCMFVSFDKLDDGIRKEILCWAIRVLVSVVSTSDNSSQDAMIKEITSFLGDLSSSLSTMEGCVKMSKNLYDNLRELKDGIINRMNLYRVACGLSEVVTDSVVDMRCKATNKTGDQCKSRRHPMGEYCSRHSGMGPGLVAPPPIAEGKILS